MTADQLITKAQHAILTNQPNLAMLYMRNALEQTLNTREAHRKRTQTPIEAAIEGFIEALRPAADALRAAGKILTDAFTPKPSHKTEFALVN